MLAPPPYYVQPIWKSHISTTYVMSESTVLGVLSVILGYSLSDRTAAFTTCPIPPLPARNAANRVRFSRRRAESSELLQPSFIVPCKLALTQYLA